LEANGFAVDLAHVDEVPDMWLYDYSLILIGPETGSGSTWGTEAALDAIRNAGVPM